MPSQMSVRVIFQRLLGSFKIYLMKVIKRKRPKHDPTDSYFYLSRQRVDFMVRADVLNLQVYPVRTEMTDMKQIPTLHICSTDEIEIKDFPVDKNLLQICSMNKDKSKSIIVN